MRSQTPEGLAAALSIAMSRIVERTVPELADRAARAHAEAPAASTAGRMVR